MEPTPNDSPNSEKPIVLALNASHEARRKEEAVPPPTAKFQLSNFPPGTLLRHKTMGVFKVHESKAWGRYTTKVADPDGIDFPKKVISGFSLREDFVKIPAALWSRYINLCFYMCPPGAKKLTRFDHDSQYEVQICILRDMATLSKWKFVVPKQVVSGVRVDADLRKSVDLETGEEYTMFPPAGWLHAGSSHSHNTMPAFFSSTDDNSELTVPGVHIVVGSVDHEKVEYDYEASIVQQKQRKTIDITKIVEVEPVANAQFHEKVLSYISVVVAKNREKSEESEWEDDFKPRKFPRSQVYKFPGAIDVTDDDDKLDGFYRMLNKENSDLFDNLEEEIDLMSLPDHVRHAIIMDDLTSSGMDRSTDSED